MTDYFKIQEKRYRKRNFRPYTDEMEERREELLSRESFNGKYTSQQRTDGLQKLFEEYWQVIVPKTAKCPHCSKDRAVVGYVDEDGEFDIDIVPCTNECERYQQKREENRFNGTSEQYNKMVRRWAKLSVEQRRELLDDFERPSMNEANPVICRNGIDHYDQGVWDQYGEELNEQAEEADLSYLDHAFVNWLVFDRNGEASWKAMSASLIKRKR